MNEFRVSRSAFRPSECILNMLSTKPGVVHLHSIVRYLYDKCKCSVAFVTYIQISRNTFYGLFGLRVHLDTSV